jgi:hypothetical protein
MAEGAAAYIEHFGMERSEPDSSFRRNAERGSGNRG